MLVDGTPEEQVEVCAKCDQGVMVERQGKFGPFLGCSRFPACTNTRNLSRARPEPQPASQVSPGGLENGANPIT